MYSNIEEKTLATHLDLDNMCCQGYMSKAMLRSNNL